MVVPIGPVSHMVVPIGPVSHMVVPIGPVSHMVVPIGPVSHMVVPIGPVSHMVVPIGPVSHMVVPIYNINAIAQAFYQVFINGENWIFKTILTQWALKISIALVKINKNATHTLGIVRPVTHVVVGTFSPCAFVKIYFLYTFYPYHP